MIITLIDYGLGNVTSVQRAFERLGITVKRTASPDDIISAEAVAVPGVGAFRKAMENLEERALAEPLRSYLFEGRPYLGICLGLQMLFTQSLEHGITQGLGIFRGSVERITGNVKVPHMGWNRVYPKGQGEEMFSGIKDGAYFYFDHSYRVMSEDDVAASLTEYGTEFVSAVRAGNIWGVQFHPEKSDSCGLRLLENFARSAGEGRDAG